LYKTAAVEVEVLADTILADVGGCCTEKRGESLRARSLLGLDEKSSDLHVLRSSVSSHALGSQTMRRMTDRRSVSPFLSSENHSWHLGCSDHVMLLHLSGSQARAVQGQSFGNPCPLREVNVDFFRSLFEFHICSKLLSLESQPSPGPAIFRLCEKTK
jgi:hypothetical protein